MRRSFAAALWVTLAAGCTQETFQKPSGEGSWILVDLVHTHLQNPIDHRLDRGVYAYQGVHGYARLFDHLGDHGFPWTATRTRRIDASLLDGFSVLFINLLHDGASDFEPDEIAAIQAFVQAGGGLFVIADHTNVYRHAERLNPLLVPMGIEVGYHTALDSESVAGSAWILIRNLSAHPTNAGIELISFQTGGTLATDFGTAFLSEAGFGDSWDEDNSEGFYGNWAFDGDPELEPQGADVAVVAAAEFGAGRVVVVGDQNIYGDVWLHFADNFAHALNGFEWVAGGAQPGALPLRAQPVRGLHIGVELSRSGYALGQGSADRYYGLFHHLNRYQEVTARAETHLDRDRDVLWLPTPRQDYSEADLIQVQAHLQKGRRVVLSLDLARLTAPTVALVQQLVPDFRFEARLGGAAEAQTLSLEGEPGDVAAAFLSADWARLQGRQPVQLPREVCPGGPWSAERLSGLRVAGFDAVPGQTELQPRLLDVSCPWGEPLFRAGGADLVRTQRVGAGELVLILQDNFLRSGTLGAKESAEPAKEARDAPELLYGLLDYLRTPIDCP